MNREGVVFFRFYFPHFIFESFSFCHFISCHFYFILFLIAINLLMFLLVRKDCCWFLTGVLVFKFRGHLDLCTLLFLIPLYCISCHIEDNMSFKVWGCGQTFCLFFFLFICCFICFCLYIFVFSIYKKFLFLFVAMLLIGHDLHHNYRLHVIGVFNLFEYCMSLEIPVFYSCVGLERLHLFD